MRRARTLESLVEEHVQRWSVAQRSGTARGAACIALSRLPGAGGAELGQAVADGLDYTFFGIEIVDQIARERNVERQLVAGLDEHVRSAIERYVLDALRPFNEDHYLKQVVRTVTTLAERGGAVFLGRGTTFILPPERCLRVLVVAPVDQRLERIAKAENLRPKDALERLAYQEEERRAFYKHHFHADPDHPAGYDLVVNTGTLGLENAGDLVIEAFRRKDAAP
jgi:cytidylate kinase